jgi:hypothetical protein
MLSCASIEMPPTCPRIQLLGSGFGQYGSILNAGPCASAAVAVNRSAPQTASSDIQ